METVLTAITFFFSGFSIGMSIANIMFANRIDKLSEKHKENLEALKAECKKMLDSDVEIIAQKNQEIRDLASQLRETSVKLQRYEDTDPDYFVKF